MKIFAIYLFVMLSINNILAQPNSLYIDCKASYLTTIKDSTKPSEFKSTNALLYYNPATDFFSFADNLSMLSTGFSKIDSMLRSNGDIKLKFECNTGLSINDFLEEEKNDKTYQIEGTLTINGVSKQNIMSYKLFPLGLDRTKIGLFMTILFDAKDYKLNYPFAKTIELTIKDAYINGLN